MLFKPGDTISQRLSDRILPKIYFQIKNLSFRIKRMSHWHKDFKGQSSPLIFHNICLLFFNLHYHYLIIFSLVDWQICVVLITYHWYMYYANNWKLKVDVWWLIDRWRTPQNGHHITDGFLTHRGWDKIDAIFAGNIYKYIFFNEMYQFRLKFHWDLFLRVRLTIFQHWFR